MIPYPNSTVSAMFYGNFLFEFQRGELLRFEFFEVNLKLF